MKATITPQLEAITRVFCKASNDKNFATADFVSGKLPRNAAVKFNANNQCASLFINGKCVMVYFLNDQSSEYFGEGN